MFPSTFVSSILGPLAGYDCEVHCEAFLAAITLSVSTAKNLNDRGRNMPDLPSTSEARGWDSSSPTYRLRFCRRRPRYKSLAAAAADQGTLSCSAANDRLPKRRPQATALREGAVNRSATIRWL